jgi:hypothetical protein
MDYPDVQLPARWPRTSEEDFALEVIYFKRWLRTLRKAEETGRVPAKVPLETVLAGWSLRRQLYRITDLSLKAKVANVGEIAKRYGLTKLWTPRYYTTLKSHLEKYLGHYPNGTLLRRYFCGRCGRAIWAEKSVRAGLGSVCIHKRGL